MEGKIDIDSLITHTLPLDRINDAFDLMHEGRSIRSVVTFRRGARSAPRRPSQWCRGGGGSAASAARAACPFIMLGGSERK